MAVEFVGGSGAITAAGSGASIGYTVGSGSNRALVVHCSDTDAALPPMDGASYNGVSMTLAQRDNDLHTFYLAAPASGANTLYLDFGGAYERVFCARSDWQGVDQTAPLGSVSHVTGTSASPDSGTVTCPSGGAIVAHQRNNYTGGGSISASSGTLIAAQRNGATGKGAAAGYRTSTGAVAFSIPGSAAWEMQVTTINAAGGGGTTHDIAVSESATATDTATTQASLVATRTEAAAAADAITAALTAAAARTESASAFDTPAVTLTTAAAATEAASATDTPSAGLLTAIARTESATATDAQTSALQAAAGVSEAAAAADAASAARAAVVTVAEAGAATDALVAALAAVAAVAEAVSAVDAVSTSPDLTLAVTEAATAADTVAAVAALVAQVAEAAAAGDQAAIAAQLVATLVEPAAAADSVAATVAAVHAVSVAEVADALELILLELLADAFTRAPADLAIDARARPLLLGLIERQRGTTLQDRRRQLGALLKGPRR
jgi:hypothetical protein